MKNLFVRNGGLNLHPKDAVEIIKNRCDFIIKHNHGVDDFIIEIENLCDFLRKCLVDEENWSDNEKARIDRLEI